MLKVYFSFAIFLFFFLLISVSSSLICPGFLQVLSSVYFSVTCQDINYPNCTVRQDPESVSHKLSVSISSEGFENWVLFQKRKMLPGHHLLKLDKHQAHENICLSQSAQIALFSGTLNGIATVNSMPPPPTSDARTPFVR